MATWFPYKLACGFITDILDKEFGTPVHETITPNVS